MRTTTIVSCAATLLMMVMQGACGGAPEVGSDGRQSSVPMAASTGSPTAIAMALPHSEAASKSQTVQLVDPVTRSAVGVWDVTADRYEFSDGFALPHRNVAITNVTSEDAALAAFHAHRGAKSDVARSEEDAKVGRGTRAPIAMVTEIVVVTEHSWYFREIGPGYDVGSIGICDKTGCAEYDWDETTSNGGDYGPPEEQN